MGVFRSYFSKNDTLIKNNVTNNSQNPITEIRYGGADKIISRYIFDINFNPIINKINSGEIKSDQISKHTLKIINGIRLLPNKIGQQYVDLTSQRTSSFDLELFNITEEWDEGSGYDFVIIDEQYPNIPEQAVNWFDRKTDTSWSVAGAYESGITEIIGTQHFEIGNEDIEIDVTDYINSIIISGNTGTTYGLGIKYTDQIEDLETQIRQVVSFYVKDSSTYFEPFIETEYNNTIKDDRNYFYLDKDNQLYLYSNVGGIPTDVTINSVEILDDSDNVIETISGSSIENIRKGVNKITVNIDSDNYVDSVLFTDRWNITQNGKSKSIDQEFFLLPQDNYYSFDNSNRILSDNYYFKFTGIKEKEKIKRGSLRKIYITTKEFYISNQANNKEFDIEYIIFVSQNNKYVFDVIPWTKVDRTINGYEITIDTSWLIPQDYSIQIRMVEGDIYHIKEKINFSLINDRLISTQN